jgi:hypothetical protein
MPNGLHEKLGAWWSHKQGLDGRLQGAAPERVLAETGWARSVGGVGPYLTLFARAGTSREAADRAAGELAIHELPAARGCTYVVPASDFALALLVSGGDKIEFRLGLQLGVTEREVGRLCEAALVALEKGPLDPEAIRDAVGGASRSLGDTGKKKGLATTLPLALGKLQAEGEIRRVPADGRFDRQRYRYALWRPNPLAKCKLTPEEAATELARRYFEWTGPASLEEFQWFSGMSGKAAKAATAPLKLAATGERLIFPEDLEKLASFRQPREAQYRLVSSIDGISLLRRDLKSIVDGADFARLVTRDKPGAVLDLPSHAIMDRGRVVGIWEYDPESESIAWLPFIVRNKDLERSVAETEEYVRTQLGDARAFSLDSPKSRAPRIAALRKAAVK